MRRRASSGAVLAVAVALAATLAVWRGSGNSIAGSGKGKVAAAPEASLATATVSGTIRHLGNPVADVEVTLSGDAGNVQISTTGADGVYSFTGVTTGTWYNIHVRPQIEDRLVWRNTRTEPLTGDLVKDFDLVSGYRLQGEVHLPDGAPYPATTWLQVEPGMSDPPLGEWVGTDLSGGAFDLVVAPGTYGLGFPERPAPYFMPMPVWTFGVAMSREWW